MFLTDEIDLISKKFDHLSWFDNIEFSKTVTISFYLLTVSKVSSSHHWSLDNLLTLYF